MDRVIVTEDSSSHPDWHLGVRSHGLAVTKLKGEGAPTGVLLGLDDVRVVVVAGMGPGGWPDEFREELRDLFTGVAACEECGSIREVECVGWDRVLLCGVHRDVKFTDAVEGL